MAAEKTYKVEPKTDNMSETFWFHSNSDEAGRLRKQSGDWVYQDENKGPVVFDSSQPVQIDFIPNRSMVRFLQGDDPQRDPVAVMGLEYSVPEWPSIFVSDPDQIFTEIQFHMNRDSGVEFDFALKDGVPSLTVGGKEMELTSSNDMSNIYTGFVDLVWEDRSRLYRDVDNGTWTFTDKFGAQHEFDPDQPLRVVFYDPEDDGQRILLTQGNTEAQMSLIYPVPDFPVFTIDKADDLLGPLHRNSVNGNGTLFELTTDGDHKQARINKQDVPLFGQTPDAVPEIEPIPSPPGHAPSPKGPLPPYLQKALQQVIDGDERVSRPKGISSPPKPLSAPGAVKPVSSSRKI